MLKARLRLPGGWSDGCILNVSSRGMMVQTSSAPAKGSYLEVRRNANVIIGRVVWSTKHRFGIRTQDNVDLDALERPPSEDAPSQTDAAQPIERRRQRRVDENRGDRNRLIGRAIEFGGVVLMVSAAAITAVGAVGDVFASPLQSVEFALERGAGG